VGTSYSGTIVGSSWSAEKGCIGSSADAAASVEQSLRMAGAEEKRNPEIGVALDYPPTSSKGEEV